MDRQQPRKTDRMIRRNINKVKKAATVSISQCGVCSHQNLTVVIVFYMRMQQCVCCCCSTTIQRGLAIIIFCFLGCCRSDVLFVVCVQLPLLLAYYFARSLKPLKQTTTTNNSEQPTTTATAGRKNVFIFICRGLFASYSAHPVILAFQHPRTLSSSTHYCLASLRLA